MPVLCSAVTSRLSADQVDGAREITPYKWVHLTKNVETTLQVEAVPRTSCSIGALRLRPLHGQSRPCTRPRPKAFASHNGPFLLRPNSYYGHYGRRMDRSGRPQGDNDIVNNIVSQ